MVIYWIESLHAIHFRFPSFARASLYVPNFCATGFCAPNTAYELGRRMPSVFVRSATEVPSYLFAQNKCIAFSSAAWAAHNTVASVLGSNVIGYAFRATSARSGWVRLAVDVAERSSRTGNRKTFLDQSL
jgi:hypothetical protein